MPATLTRRPQATAFSIEDLLDSVRRGEVRIPEFQRPLRWTAEDVRDLFDSVYRGYPIGTLLFWKREAPAASVTLGPVRIDAPSTSQALWVVDGQQRITALTGVLLHPEDGERDDFSLFFDLETEEVVSSASDATPPQHWLPLRVVLDSELLLEWLNRYPGRAQHLEHTRRAIRFGKAIREYQVPAYVVEAAEEKTLRIIFKRLNTAGNPLIETEVFNALYGGVAGSRPASLGALAEDLKALSFGTLDESTLLELVLAVRGLDFTQSFQRQLREEDDLSETLQATQRALRDTIIFLKRDAGLAHLRLLPKPFSLHVLVRFFYLHPEPSPRSRELLSRWLWRRAVAGTLMDLTAWLSEPKELLACLQVDEEQAVQALLADLPAPNPNWGMPNSRIRHFNLEEPVSRLEANALLSLRPRHLLTGTPLDVASLVDELGPVAFRPIVTPKSLSRLTLSVRSLMWIVANRLFHPPLSDRSLFEVLVTPGHAASEALESHAILPTGLALLQGGEHVEFLKQRTLALNDLTIRFLKARTRWDESDRPSLQSLIVDDEED
ncbi:DUF262 domain-containing protein [Pyxidicoccus trucidator]|uniref:DUF262 domain-containing protein n=1 Tax=Pyxidicoccus trucidator TaxID=2709662 RepID=UPI0013D9F005|nr:DUF262 domain-containing protein [Pyxidicoccus trucidator]